MFKKIITDLLKCIEHELDDTSTQHSTDTDAIKVTIPTECTAHRISISIKTR